MEKQELSKIIVKLLDEENSLSDIQKILDTDYNHKMTFLELRMVASELENIDWTKGEEPEKTEDTGEEKEITQEKEVSDENGKTVIEISKLTRPGVALSGSVNFASGATAEWVLDQFGKLAFEKSEGKPTEEDLSEFQKELQKALGAG